MNMHHLECPKCKECYSTDHSINLCKCGSPLLVKVNMVQVKKVLNMPKLVQRCFNLWRYIELLPVNEENIISLGEGGTPLYKLNNMGKKLELVNLYLKDEGLNPTGTFKARGASVGISKVKELGISEICMPTAGNAGGAWASYAAKAKIKAHIYMPKDAPDLAKKESYLAGAEVKLIDGLISDAGSMSSKASNKYGWFDVATLKEPYRIEGKKTMGFEIAEQMNWEIPDWVIYPAGGGVGLIGIWKAILELEELGWTNGKRPKMVAVQADGCAPIVRAYNAGEKESVFWENAQTIAGGIRVPKALGDFLVLDAIYKSGGCAIAVSDDDIVDAMKEMAVEEGLFICPEGAANLVALKKLIAENAINNVDKVVLLNTGTGLKYAELININLPILKASDTARL